MTHIERRIQLEAIKNSKQKRFKTYRVEKSVKLDEAVQKICVFKQTQAEKESFLGTKNAPKAIMFRFSKTLERLFDSILSKNEGETQRYLTQTKQQPETYNKGFNKNFGNFTIPTEEVVTQTTCDVLKNFSKTNNLDEISFIDSVLNAMEKYSCDNEYLRNALISRASQIESIQENI